MRLTALLLTVPGAAVTPLLTAQPAAAATETGGTVCMRSATDGVYRWNGGTSWTQISGRGTAEQIVPCKAPGTTNAEEAANTPNQSLCATGPVSDLDDALSEIWDDPELTALQKVLAVQYLTSNWATTVGLEANACQALADAYAAVVRGL